MPVFSVDQTTGNVFVPRATFTTFSVATCTPDLSMCNTTEVFTGNTEYNAFSTQIADSVLYVAMQARTGKVGTHAAFLGVIPLPVNASTAILKRADSFSGEAFGGLTPSVAVHASGGGGVDVFVGYRDYEHNRWMVAKCTSSSGYSCSVRKETETATIGGSRLYAPGMAVVGSKLEVVVGLNNAEGGVTPSRISCGLSLGSCTTTSLGDGEEEANLPVLARGTPENASSLWVTGSFKRGNSTTRSTYGASRFDCPVSGNGGGCTIASATPDPTTLVPYSVRFSSVLDVEHNRLYTGLLTTLPSPPLVGMPKFSKLIVYDVASNWTFIVNVTDVAPISSSGPPRLGLNTKDNVVLVSSDLPVESGPIMTYVARFVCDLGPAEKIDRPLAYSYERETLTWRRQAPCEPSQGVVPLNQVCTSSGAWVGNGCSLKASLWEAAFPSLMVAGVPYNFTLQYDKGKEPGLTWVDVQVEVDTPRTRGVTNVELVFDSSSKTFVATLEGLTVSAEVTLRPIIEATPYYASVSLPLLPNVNEFGGECSVAGETIVLAPGGGDVDVAITLVDVYGNVLCGNTSVVDVGSCMDVVGSRLSAVFVRNGTGVITSVPLAFDDATGEAVISGYDLKGEGEHTLIVFYDNDQAFPTTSYIVPPTPPPSPTPSGSPSASSLSRTATIAISVSASVLFVSLLVVGLVLKLRSSRQSPTEGVPLLKP